MNGTIRAVRAGQAAVRGTKLREAPNYLISKMSDLSVQIIKKKPSKKFASRMADNHFCNYQ